MITTLEETYTSLIQQYLSLMLYENAIFLSERYVASSKASSAADSNSTAQSNYLLASCFYKSGSVKEAIYILEHEITFSESPSSLSNSSNDLQQSCQYLLSKCYYDIREYAKAEESLFQFRNKARLHLKKYMNQLNNNSTSNSEEELLNECHKCVPNGAAGFYLLGNIYRKTCRVERAIEYYTISLKLDPFMWCSFEALCELGEGLNVDNIFGIEEEPQHSKQKEEASFLDSAMMHNKVACGASSFLSPNLTAINQEEDGKEEQTQGEQRSLFTSMVDMSYSTPPMNSSAYKLNSQSSHKQQPTLPPPPPLSKGRFYNTPNLTPISKEPNTNNKRTSTKKMTSSPHVMKRAKTVVSRLYYKPSPDEFIIKSTKLDSVSSAAGTATPKKQQVTTFNVGCGAELGALFHTAFPTVSSSKQEFPDTSGGVLASLTQDDSTHTNAEKPTLSNNSNDNSTSTNNVHLTQILFLFSTLGTAYQYLCHYQCKEAIETYQQQLSHEQFHTGYVQEKIGKAYFELADYHNAKRSLQYMTHLEPYRLQGLDVLSTTYWHLKQEVELCALSQTLKEFNTHHYMTWIVVGNCFSLQKEHETALLFIRRAIQLNPDACPYAYTLLGHEYVSNEDLEQANIAYRHAIRIDARHYNAWYGLGSILYRQEKFDSAIYHFKKALSIHSNSSILLCYLGMAQYANNMLHDALATLELSTKLNGIPNPQAQFQRATIYKEMHRYHEALVDLEQVRDVAPRDASVYFNMGNIYKKLKDKNKAMRCFLLALDLDPKDNNVIKAAMERLDVVGVDFDEDEDDEDEEHPIGVSGF